MRLRFWGDDKHMFGATALECLRSHCRGVHSEEGQRGDVDAVMARLAATFNLDRGYADKPTLEARCEALVETAIACGLMVDATLSP